MESLNNNKDEGSSQNELIHSCMMRSDGLAMFYLQGIRSFFIEPSFSYNNKKHFISAKSPSTKSDESHLTCKVKGCDISGTTTIDESKKGIKYLFHAIPSNQAQSLDVILSVQLFPDVWMNGEIISTNKRETFVIQGNFERIVLIDFFKKIEKNLPIGTLNPQISP